MGTLNEDLTEIKRVEDTLTNNKVARFAYTEKAYTDNDANGVDVYNASKEQNIPTASTSVMKVNATVLNKGYRAQASSITRMLMNHFLGRLSYNVNKLTDNMENLLNTLKTHLGTANGFASLDDKGKVPVTQLPVTAGNIFSPYLGRTLRKVSGSPIKADYVNGYYYFCSSSELWRMTDLNDESTKEECDLVIHGAPYKSIGFDGARYFCVIPRPQGTDYGEVVSFSTDGVHWTDDSRFLFTGYIDITAKAFKGNVIIRVVSGSGSDSDNVYACTADNIKITLLSNVKFYSAAASTVYIFSDKLFLLAVDTSTNKMCIWLSTDGKTMNKVYTFSSSADCSLYYAGNTTENLYMVKYGISTSFKLVTSSDGTNWVEEDIASIEPTQTITLYKVNAFKDNSQNLRMYIHIMIAGYYHIYTKTSKEKSWTRLMDVKPYVNMATEGDAFFLFISDTKTIPNDCYVSTNGTVFQKMNISINTSWQIKYNNGCFYAVAKLNIDSKGNIPTTTNTTVNAILKSFDGINWIVLHTFTSTSSTSNIKVICTKEALIVNTISGSMLFDTVHNMIEEGLVQV